MLSACDVPSVQLDPLYHSFEISCDESIEIIGSKHFKHWNVNIPMNVPAILNIDRKDPVNVSKNLVQHRLC